MRTSRLSARFAVPLAFLTILLCDSRPVTAQGNIDWEDLWMVTPPASPAHPTYGWMAGQRQYTGIAYDKFRNVIYVVNPAMTTVGNVTYPAPKIRILDPATGLPMNSMGRDALTGKGGVLPTPMDTIVGARGWPGNSWGGFAQGQFSLYKVDVDDEGRIYACNLVAPAWGECRPGPAPNCDSAYLDQGPFRIYRWDTPTSTPQRVYATLNESATAIGSLASSEMPQMRLGDAFDVVGKHEVYLDPWTQQYMLFDNTKIYVSGPAAASAHDEILVIRTDPYCTVSNGLGSNLKMRVAKRLVSPLSGHSGSGVSAEDAGPLAAIWMARGGAYVVKALQHANANWPQVDTLSIVSQLSTDSIVGTGMCGPIDVITVDTWTQPVHRFATLLACADGFPTNPSQPQGLNTHIRARVMDIAFTGKEERRDGLGDTPWPWGSFGGGRPFDTLASPGSYVSDLSFRIEPNIDSGRCPHINLYLLMSNNYIAAFRTRDGWNNWCTKPVTLRSFNASLIVEAVGLSWEVEKEEAFFGYDVQRRMGDNAAFESIGFVAAEGTQSGRRSYTFNDPLTPQHRVSHRIEYRLKQIDTDGSFEYSPIAEVQIAHNNEVVLEQNHPNPFNPSTTISYIIPEASHVRMTLVNTLGRTMRTLVDDYQPAGAHHFVLDASDLPSGSYTYRLEAGGVVLGRRLTVLR